MQVTQLLRRTAVLAAIALAACGDDDDPVAPPGTLAVTASRPDLTITQGASDTLTLNISRGGSFTGPVTLATSGAPTGATVTLASETLASGTTSTAATITVVAAVAPGTYPITVTAAGTGITPSPTTTVNLAVVAAQVVDFSIASSVDTLTLAPGDSSTGYLRLTRTGGFASAVSLTTDSLPEGVTVAFTDTALAADSTLYTLRAESTATAGGFDIVLRGTSGTTTHIDSIRVNLAVPAGYSLGVEPDTLTLVAGTNGQVVVRATRVGGLADTVNLVINGAPVGVTGTFGSAALGGDSTVLTIAASDATVAGTYAIEVQGTAGTLVRTDTLQLTVTAPPAGNSLDISLVSAGDSIAAGATDTITVVAARTGFAGPVTLTTDSLPAGVTVLIDTAGIAGDTLLVPISVDSTAVAGAYTIRFIGSAAGVASDTASYSLVVTAAGGGSAGRVAALTRTTKVTPRAEPRRTGRTPSTPRRQ